MKHVVVFLAALFLTTIQPSTLAFDKDAFVRDIERAKAHFGEGKQRQAIAYWEKLRSKYGGAQGHYENELGNFYSLAGMHDKAEKAYRDGIALKTKYPRLYIGLAHVYLDQNRSAEAGKWAKRAVEEFPGWWLGYSTLGHIEWKQNNLVSAKTWLTKSLNIDRQALTYWLLAIVSYELKDPQAVVESMEAAVNLDRTYMGNEHGMSVAAIALAQLGRYKDAYAAVDTLRKNNPEVKEADIQLVLSNINKLERQRDGKK